MKKLKSMLCILLSLILIACICPAAFSAQSGTDYYVDSVGGDDSNPGTSSSAAFKSLAKASSVTYQPGDRVLLKAGGYFDGTFAAKGSGTAESPVTLGAYGDIDALGKPMLTVSGNNAAVEMKNVSNWVVRDLDISAHDGRGIYIICSEGRMSGITVENCSLHNIFDQRSETQVIGSHASIGINSVGPGLLSDIVLRGNDIRDCGYGIWSDGNNIEWSQTYYTNPEESYTQNLLYENITMNNVYYDGIAIGSVNHLTIRNCVLLSTSLYTDFYTAPTWMHHAKNVLVENCEIAGSTNTMDGMAVDFDGWTTDSMYQYIYSHDNVRFMQNCVYDDETCNRNCTVRYCLSVNDNKETNNASQLLGKDAYIGMDNFKFYNNTIVNGGKFDFACNLNSIIANNIFISADGLGEIQMARNTSKNGLHKFDGIVTNNCFIGYAVPTASKNTAPAYAGFVGGDLYDINSYRLSASSPLIGKGIQVEEDMGEHDFYGNPLTATHNIGCYDGEGIDDGSSFSALERIKSLASMIFYRLFGAVLAIINIF